MEISQAEVRFSLVHQRKRMGRMTRTPEVRISFSRLSPATASPDFAPLPMARGCLGFSSGSTAEGTALGILKAHNCDSHIGSTMEQ